MKLLKKLWYSESIRYLFIGGCTTLLSLVLFYIFCDVFSMNVTLGNVLSIIISILFAYITNRLFVFASKNYGVKAVFLEFCRFIGGRLATMILEVGGVYLLYDILGQPKMVAKLITQVLVIVGNYFISKFLVFRK